jgi:hypothetical protein
MELRSTIMRRILPVAFGCLLLAFPLFAQRGGGHGGGGGGHMGGGGAHFSGGGGFRGGTAFRGGTGFRGNTFRTFNGFRGIGFRGRYGYGFYGGLWGYPWLYGGLWNDCFWDSDYCYGYPGSGYGYADNGGYYPSYAPSYSEPSPGVLIISNQMPPQQGFAPPPPAPSVWNAAPPTTQAQKYEEPLYLLAMHDGTIRAVLAYWVDGKTVHYVTMDHEQKTTPLGSLDRGLSERLNRERNVTFQLPG